MTQKTYDYGGRRVTLEQLRELDPMTASNIEDESPPQKESKSDRMTSDLLVLWLGLFFGGVVVWMFLK